MEFQYYIHFGQYTHLMGSGRPPLAAVEFWNVWKHFYQGVQSNRKIGIFQLALTIFYFITFGNNNNGQHQSFPVSVQLKKKLITLLSITTILITLCYIWLRGLGGVWSSILTYLQSFLIIWISINKTIPKPYIFWNLGSIERHALHRILVYAPKVRGCDFNGTWIIGVHHESTWAHF